MKRVANGALIQVKSNVIERTASHTFQDVRFDEQIVLDTPD